MTVQQGLSLSELLIGLFLSSAISAGLLGHYLHTKEHVQSAKLAIEQAIELQLVGDFIRMNVRAAGYTPCLRLDHLMTSNKQGEHGKLAAIEIAPQSLLIHRMSEQFNTVLQGVDERQLSVTADYLFKPQQTVLIADCYHAEIQTVEHVSHSSANQVLHLKNSLVFSYQPPIYIGELVQAHFFIHSRLAHKPALFYDANRPEELTAMVHDLQAAFKKNKKKTLLQVTLGLDQGKTMELDTAVKAW